MPKTNTLFGLSLVLLVGCSLSNENSTTTAKKMVYEGMSADELIQTLGNPNSVAIRDSIFDANSMSKMAVEQWNYSKRSVLLINDSVKHPNINSGGED